MSVQTSDGVSWRLTSLLLLAAAVGVLAGFAEAAFLQTQRILLDRIVFMGRHAWWMKPIAEGVLFASLAVIGLAASRLLPVLATLRFVGTLVGFLGAFSLLLMISRLHIAAQLLLSIGVGVQAGRIVGRVLGPRESLVRRMAFVVLASVPVVGFLGFPRSDQRPRSAPDGEGQVPNVLLLVLDTVRARSLSAFGHVRPTTPVLERVASEGVLFEWALAPAPWTLSSHASMFTGFLPRELSTSWRTPLDDARPTLAEVLSKAGYATGGFVANQAYASWETGLDRGFQHYEDHPVSLRQLATESSIVRWVLAHGLAFQLLGRDENLVRKDAASVNAGFLDWLDSLDGRPFFAFLNYYDAHGPYQPPEPYRSRFADGEPRGPISPLHRWLEDPFEPLPDEAVLRREQRAYEAAIAALDADIGRLLEELESRGVLSRTLLIVTSDHGEEFGEYGLFDHGNSMYLDGLHVPLIMRWPGRLDGGSRVSTTVSLRDLPFTISRLIGIQNDFPGSSLAELVVSDGGPSESEPVIAQLEAGIRLPEWFPVSRGEMATLTDDEWHLIRNGDGQVELYSLAETPGNARDLSGDPETRAVADSLAAELAARVGGS